MHSFLSIVVEWIPMLLLVALWVYFMRGFVRKGALKQMNYLEEQLTEAKRHNAVMEGLLHEIKDRIDRIEPESKKSISS